MAEVVTRVMVADTVNNKAVAMVANKADMAVMENAVMNAEMMIRMDSSKAAVTADNKEGMVEMVNAATSDEMILMGSSKAEAMVEVNKVGVMEEGSKVEATVEATAEGRKVVAMVEVNKADMIKVAVVATALKTALAEDMEEEGASFKKVEDLVKALEVTSIPTKLSATPSNMAAEIATCSRLHCLSWAARTSTISQAQMSRS